MKMGRVSIKLDGFDLEKLITGEALKFSVHISPVDQITIETTPNAVSNLKTFIYHSASISHEEIRDNTADMLKRKLILNPKSITDVETMGQILKDEE